jgi:ribosome recycling factor
MSRAVEILKQDFGSIRAGRATPQLLDKIQVEAWGASQPVNAVATISVPEPRLLVIQPWDKSVIAAIEKAILKSDLGITPNNDGQVIRLAMPQLTEQRRQDLAKQVRKRAEEQKVAVRNCRRDADGALKKIEKDGKGSQDEVRRATDRVQKITDGWVKEIEDTAARKEKEVKEV